MEWIERQKRVFLHFTPTSASWLNLVERFFSTVTRKHYIETYNEDPKPLVWTKPAAQILKKVERARLALAAAAA